ncbi:MAG: UDP-N-acetylglucosamine--N-acetylmuramyl-(pentapeptide) pyrophosphoryl-undecaprenol N-acetylglucosamine transferase [Candidatus Caenarcaniphilales bacterium]|nr:UDP-N-acetylglucosamine--N-acetylmuramyl-(pentapeptide) pyrophosphoryl-undecaprenol N-acetylglucosamine transferase [Candidatus Caenarcaniphilales bacterium]
MKRANNAGQKKLFFTGGGTGGHIYPNLALAQDLREKHPDLKLAYLGSYGKLEEKLASGHDLQFIPIPFIGGMPRSLLALGWGMRLLMAIWKVFWLLRKDPPCLIFGTGGYSAAPVFAAAVLLKIPYIIHNLDTYIGLANQLFIPCAAALTLGMPPTGHSGHYPQPKDGPVLVTGNPVRRELLELKSNSEEIRARLGLKPDLPVLVVVGGSQGAQIINENFFAVVGDLLAENWQIIHQLGEKQYATFEDRFPIHPSYKPYRYLEKIWEIYSVADLAVSRAGAMSLAELTTMSIPTLYIPLASAAQNHQELNAKYISDRGAAEILVQKDLSPSNLKAKLKELHNKRADISEKLKPLQENQSKANNQLMKVVESFRSRL